MTIDLEFSRRSLLQLAAAFVPIGVSGLPLGSFGGGAGGQAAAPVDENFPAYPPEMVREMVTVAHFDLKRVKELVEAQSSLAVASWDWGFGDRELPLEAASHMGNRAIAEYLLSRGARPSLFSAAMLGELDVVKAFVAAAPGVERIPGPHGISLLGHARMGGQAAKPVLDFLQSLGDADFDAPVPLPEPEAAALAGTYVFGPGATEQVVVDTDLKMYGGGMMYTHPPQLNWTRKGTMTRPLFHLGGLVFYPGGGGSARITFTSAPEGTVMVVTDGDRGLTARKIPAPK